MVNETVKLIRADWDLRPKTKFLTIEGYVMVESPNDEVIAEIAVPPGINPKILLIRVTVKPSKGPKKPQPVPFYLSEMTQGDEPWTHVQVLFDGKSDTMPITKLIWAGEVESITLE